MPRYFTNHDYFDNINQHSAYIIGFILGDGSIGTNDSGNYIICVSIHRQDEEVINFIASQISPREINYSCMTQKSGLITPYARIKITSNKIGRFLVNLGITPAKTGKEILPSIPEEYMPDMLRGLFDADGSLAEKNKAGYSIKTPHLSITSASKRMLEQIKDYLGYGRVSLNHGCWDFNITDRIGICRFGKLIYCSSDGFYLKRKKDRFDRMKKPRLFAAFGEVKSIKDWAEDHRCTISYGGLHRRVTMAGMPMELALSTPNHVQLAGYKQVNNNKPIDGIRLVDCSIDDYVLPTNL